MEILHELKSNPQTENTPAMFISDYQDAQIAAVAAGASPDLGKGWITPKLLSFYPIFSKRKVSSLKGCTLRPTSIEETK